MAGVKAQPQSLVVSDCFQQGRELVDRASQRAAGAGRVLQVKRTALAVGKRLADRLTGARDRLGNIAGLGRARVQDNARGADRRVRHAANA